VVAEGIAEIGAGLKPNRPAPTKKYAETMFSIFKNRALVVSFVQSLFENTAPAFCFLMTPLVAPLIYALAT
jgi:hypothetical protein